jgi:hypothetical protein
VLIFAGVKASSAAIVADDATIVATGDDILLVPIALAAIATYILTNSRASSEEIAQAWRQVAQRIQELSTTLDQIVHLTSRGRQADIGIMEEVREILLNRGIPPNDDDEICKVLQDLYQVARRQVQQRRFQPYSLYSERTMRGCGVVLPRCWGNSGANASNRWALLSRRYSLILKCWLEM